MALIAFRVDASLQIGNGHVMRCLTLADAARERGARCIFVCRPHQGHLLDLIAKSGYQALALPALEYGPMPSRYGSNYAHWLGTDWVTDAHSTQQLLSIHIGNEPVDWLVVDHYALDAGWEQALLPQYRQIMVIDDLADRPHVCDLLLDQNLGRKLQDYESLLKGETIILIGSEYALLRPEFAAIRPKSLARRQKSLQLRRLLISMGGVDKDNATGHVLVAIKSCEMPANLQITIVMGPHAPWLAKIQAQASQMPWRTEVLVGVNNMAQLMTESDLAIGGAGLTSWERCCLGLPSIVYPLAKNQASNCQILAHARASVVMRPIEQLDADEHIQMLEEALSKYQTVAEEMILASADLCDGQGCQRIVNLLFKDK